MSSSVDEDDGLSIFRANYSPPGSPNTKPVSSKKKKSASLLSRVFLRLRGRKGKDVDLGENVFPDEETEKEGSLVKYIYQELDPATAGFCSKNIFGSGGSSTVYRGFLKGSNGQFMDVAIKDFPTAYVNLEASRYFAEIKLLNSLNHKNLVKLLGWCQETGRLLIVYEFVPNNTLASYLHGPYPASSLPWDVRYRKIATGMASALLYLQTGPGVPHETCGLRVRQTGWVRIPRY